MGERFSHIAVLLYCLVFIPSLSGSLTIVSRAEWGAHESTQTLSNLGVPVTYAVVHHTVTDECDNINSCSGVVRSIQTYHMTPRPNGKGWWDIGYNFLIGGDGKVYEGRGWNKRGAHAGDLNSQSIGISMIGTFTSRMPTQAALNALDDLIALGVTNGKLDTNYIVKGHKDVSATYCPGSLFHTNHVKNMNNYQP